MKTLKGKGVSGGTAFGTLYFYKHITPTAERRSIEDADGEVERYQKANEKVKISLQTLYEKALRETGEHEAEIFQIHQMMLDDADYVNSIVEIIRKEHVNAEYAVGKTASRFAALFTKMDDSYMKARAADVRDISEKLIAALLSHDAVSLNPEKPVVLVADDLMPSETVQLDRTKVLGFAFLHGSANAHTAILARTMNIPAVIGLAGQFDETCSGQRAILNGDTGEVCLEPDADAEDRMRSLHRHELEHRAGLELLRGKEDISKDGRHIDIYANIGHVSDVDAALQNDAGGIGLFRSEFLYLENTDYPTEEEQFEAYKAVLAGMEGRPVIIRTMDIGADKKVDYLGLPEEANPALGLRAIRVCLERPEIFRTQLRALYRASVYGTLGIMFPMIASVWEIRRIHEIIEKVKMELRSEGKPFSNDVRLGVMIETPAAAIISDDLAKEVDFFSIGTNDLTQYTLAADRQNETLGRFCDPHHKAVLRLIRQVVENAHRQGVKVGICGELGADLTMTKTFLAMGIDELSVTPSKVLEVRSKVRSCSVGGEAAGLQHSIER